MAYQPRKTDVAGGNGPRTDQQEQRRLGVSGEGCLPGRAHTLEGTADIHGREHQEQARQADHIGEHDEVVVEAQRRIGTERRSDHRREHRRAQHHPGAGAKQRRCHFADDRLLARQTEQVIRALQQPRSATPSPPRLGAIDESDHQHRQDQHRQNMSHEQYQRHGNGPLDSTTRPAITPKAMSAPAKATRGSSSRSRSDSRPADASPWPMTEYSRRSTASTQLVAT